MIDLTKINIDKSLKDMNIKELNELSHEIRCFLLSNISKNKGFIIIMLSVLIIQLSMIYFGGDLFRCAPLSIDKLIIVWLLSISVIIFDILRKIFVKFFKKT